MKRFAYRGTAIAAAALLALGLSACIAPNDSASSTGSTAGGDGDAPAPRSLGLIEVTITGIGTPIMDAEAKSVRYPEAGAVGAKSLTPDPNGLDLSRDALSGFNYGVRSAGGERYIYASFKVRNAQACGTPGSCTAYASPSHNLTLIGAITASTLSQTAVSKLFKFDGTAAPAALATQLLPIHGVDFDGTELLVHPGLDSFQAFTEAEVASIALDAGVTGLLPYGFVVENLSNANSRALPGSPAVGQYDGRVTLGLKLPLQATAANDPYSISLLFDVVDDSNPRVSESVDAQTAPGDAYENLAAARLGSADLVALGGAHVAQTNIGDPICTIRIAGTAASPTAYLVNAGASPNVAAAPYNVGGLAPGGSIRAGFCQPMTTPAGIYSQFAVSGNQSGSRSNNSFGSYAGGGTRVLSFTPSAAHAFFAGERVSFSLSSALSSASSTHPAAFVGSFTAGGIAASDGDFLSRTTTATESFPISIAIGDFNGDGKADQAIANLSGGITILLGNGDGGFHAAPASPVTAGSSPFAIVTGDFNGDGKLDLATANYTDNNVSILLGDGRGGFNPAAGSPHSAGAQPSSIAVGDFNANGKLDLAITNQGSGDVTILLGNGAGGFSNAAGSPVALAAGSNPNSVAVSDFNGDGRQDLVVQATGSKVAILLGNGSGGFSAGASITVGTNPNFVAVGDLNGDGKADLVVCNTNSNNLSILLGNGSGGFSNAAGSPLTVGTRPVSTTIGDLDGDGKPDLAVVNQDDDAVSILLGNGSGGFSTAAGSPLGVNSQPSFVALGDFNADGKPDLAVTNSASNNVSILLGNGNGVFVPPLIIPQPRAGVGTAPYGAAAGDFDGDGVLDIAVANSGSNNLSILLGSGDGGFNAAVGSPLSVGTTPFAVATGDFNGDGKLDLAVPNYASNSLTILLGNGAGGFSNAAGSPLSVTTNPYSVAVGDFNGDGKVDLASANFSSANVSILLGNGSGGFSAAGGSPVGVGSGPVAIIAGDFNGDGKLDLATANDGSSNVSILLGNGTGGFSNAPGSPVNSGTGTFSIASADFNGDGIPDLAMANYNSNNISILLGKGDGSFRPTPGSPINVGTNPYSIAAGDLNGDGLPDLAVTLSGDNAVSILLGDGSGSFSSRPSSPVAVGKTPVSVLIADFFGTHKLGLAVSNNGGNGISIVPQR